MYDFKYYEDIDNKVVALMDRLESVDKQAYYIFKLLYATGARVSELENVPTWKIKLQDKLEIPPLKSSNMRQITISEDPVLSTLDKNKMEYYLQIYTESKASYYTNKYISRHHVRQSDMQPVTHIFRYLYIVRQLSAHDDVFIIKEKLGHKVVQTTMSYLNNLIKTEQG